MNRPIIKLLGKKIIYVLSLFFYDILIFKWASYDHFWILMFYILIAHLKI